MTECLIVPLVKLKKNQGKEHNEVSIAYEQIIESDFIDSQYRWLGAFLAQYPGIKLCIHEDDRAMREINIQGKLNFCQDSQKALLCYYAQITKDKSYGFYKV